MSEENSQWIIQARAHPDGEEFVAECIHLPIQLRAASLDQAVAELHQAIQEYLKEHRDQAPQDAVFKVVLAFYFGPLTY